MKMEVGGIEVVRDVAEQRHGVRVCRQLVEELNAEGVARLRAQRRSGNRPLVSTHVEPVATDLVDRIANVKLGLEHAAARLSYLWFDEILRLPGAHTGNPGVPGLATVPGVLRLRRGVRAPDLASAASGDEGSAPD